MFRMKFLCEVNSIVIVNEEWYLMRFIGRNVLNWYSVQLSISLLVNCHWWQIWNGPQRIFIKRSWIELCSAYNLSQFKFANKFKSWFWSLTSFITTHLFLCIEAVDANGTISVSQIYTILCFLLILNIQLLPCIQTLPLKTVSIMHASFHLQTDLRASASL